MQQRVVISDGAVDEVVTTLHTEVTITVVLVVVAVTGTLRTRTVPVSNVFKSV